MADPLRQPTLPTHNAWARLCRGLWKVLGVIGTLIILPLIVNVLSTWLVSSKGIIPSDSPFSWLIIHWPITLSVGCVLLLIAVFIWALSREQVRLTITRQNRAMLIGRLRLAYQDQLRQSLQKTAWLDLELSSKPEAVRLHLRLSAQPEQELPAGTTILEAYDKAEHELLILGEPGTGKSTLLLELAQRLVERAVTDESHPLPVILPLSSWAVRHPPLQDWLSEQLAFIYDMRRDVSQQLVQEEQILPLLDGLDEMEASSRTACIKAINTYHHEHLLPMVICCRMTEYEAASEQERLVLNRAVVVQPLTAQQVESYLIQAGPPSAPLRAALREQPLLWELITTPLMLNILLLTSQKGSVTKLGSTRQVFANYIERMVKSKGNVRRYSLYQTNKWLHWLAQQMRKDYQTIFSLEQLRPHWLPEGPRAFYRWSVVLFYGLLLVLFYGLLLVLFGRLTSGLGSRLGGGDLTGLLIGLGGTLIVMLIVIYLDKLRTALTLVPLFVLLFGVPLWLIGKLGGGLLFGVLTGLGSGLGGALIRAILGELVQSETTNPGDYGFDFSLGRGGRLHEGLFLGLPFGLGGGLFGGLLFGLGGGLLIRLLAGLVLGLLFMVLTRPWLGDESPDRYPKGWGSANRLLVWLGGALPFGLSAGLVGGLLGGLPAGLLSGLPFVLFFGLHWGLYSGLLRELTAKLSDVVQHYILRFWLWQTHIFPWKAESFLEDATARILLRRVGSGYSFIHRLLLDFFADLEKDDA